jgi:hypothetical protein
MSIQGIKTNIPLHQELMLDARFIEGGTSIHYLEQKLADQGRSEEVDDGLVKCQFPDRRIARRSVVRRLDGGRGAVCFRLRMPMPVRRMSKPQFGEPGSINSPGWDHSRVVALLEPDADVPALLAEASAASG